MTPRDDFIERELSESVIGAFLDSYYRLGFGFSETIYVNALHRELRKRGHTARRETAVEVLYDGARIGWYRLDMIVDGRLVVEIKATETPESASRGPPRTPVRIL